MPDFIGITAMTTKFGSVIQTARICKTALPHVPVIVGGPHASAMPELTMEVGEIDYVLRGEADETLPQLLAKLRDKGNLEALGGLTWRRHHRVVHNQDAPFVQDLDSLPIPDRGALMHPQHYSSEDMGVLLTSRGCPYRCSYCFHTWDRQVRFHSVARMIDEIREVRRQCGTAQFSIKDDSFTVRRQHVLDLCEAINKEPFRIGFSCTTRVNLIDDDLLVAMKKAGCMQVNVGIESGSDRILELTDKDITRAQVRNAAQLLNKHRIFWSGYFMVGLPQETEEDIRATVRFLKTVRPSYGGIGVYNPFPRTKLFEQGVELGLLDPRPSIDSFLKTNPKDLFFKDPRRRVLAISPEQLDALVQETMREFQGYNSNLFNVARRGFARRRTYMADPSLLWRDVGKACEFVALRLPTTRCRRCR